MIHRMLKAAWAEMRMILHNRLDFEALLYWRTVCLSAHSPLKSERSPCHLPLTGNKPWHPNGVNQRFRNWNQGTSILALDIHEVHSWHRFFANQKQVTRQNCVFRCVTEGALLCPYFSLPPSLHVWINTIAFFPYDAHPSTVPLKNIWHYFESSRKQVSFDWRDINTDIQ